jgi:long-chain acyl-CoA synthetase
MTSTSSSNDNTIIDYFLANVAKLGDRRFLTQPMGGDTMLYYTFNEFLAEAKKMAGYIESLNYPPKSQIAICSKNCAWWIVADLAIWMSGHVSVPVYPTCECLCVMFMFTLVVVVALLCCR